MPGDPALVPSPGSGSGSDLASGSDVRGAAPAVGRVITAGGRAEPRGHQGHQRQHSQRHRGGHEDTGVTRKRARPSGDF